MGFPTCQPSRRGSGRRSLQVGGVQAGRQRERVDGHRAPRRLVGEEKVRAADVLGDGELAVPQVRLREDRAAVCAAFGLAF